MSAQQPDPLKPGDRVRHCWFPDGPVMVVESLQTHEGELRRVHCAWFSPDGHFHRLQLPPAEAVPVEPSATP